MKQFIEDNEKGKDISKLTIDTSKYAKPTIKKETAHQTLVNAILDATGDKSFVRWVGIVSRSKLSANQILDVIKKAKELPEKYNKSGFIVNKLTGKK